MRPHPNGVREHLWRACVARPVFGRAFSFPTPQRTLGSHPRLSLLGFRARGPKFPPGQALPGVFKRLVSALREGKSNAPQAPAIATQLCIDVAQCRRSAVVEYQATYQQYLGWMPLDQIIKRHPTSVSYDGEGKV